MIKLLIPLTILAWLLSILTVIGGEFSILATAIFLQLVSTFLLLFILFKKNG